MPFDGVLARAKSQVEEYCKGILDYYIVRLDTHRNRPALKEFNDPVWQTIVLQPLEVALVDSPLLQRLRNFRQLGVVHWVYPGATHTRFEHSIGAVFQVSALVDALNSRVTSPHSVVQPSWKSLFRIAALVHDIGHCAMSHVSEYAIRDRDEVEDLLFEFCREQDIESVKLSEFLTHAMLGSASFERLLDAALRVAPTDLPSQPVELLQKMILGRVVQDDAPLIQELISGPFDCDKLDYMTRDAHCAGVPVVTDIPRLIQKIRAVQLTQDRLPERIAAKVRRGLPGYWVTGIALSGGRTLDELLLGRSLLFDKIYRHQKVRAIEAMIGAMLNGALDASSSDLITTLLSLRDEELVHFDEVDLKRKFGIEGEGADSPKVAAAMEISRRLRDRELFVRCVAFSQHMPLDPYQKDEDQVRSLERLIREANKSQERRLVVEKIAKETETILGRLGLEELRKAFPIDVLRTFIWIDPPRTPESDSEIYQAFLIAQDGNLVPFREDTAEARGWADAYLLARDLGYIFCVAELAPFVYLAAEVVLRHEYGVRLPRSMQSYSKHPGQEVENLRIELDRRSYYSSASHDLRPVPHRLTRADVDQKVDRFLTTFQGYLGPSGRGDPPSLSKQRVLDWLRQFENDDRSDLALEVLVRLQFLSRSAIVASVSEHVRRHREFEGAFVCPLGEPKDSSAICTYLTNDADRALRLRVCRLEEALAVKQKAPIIFVDDFIGSGKQSVSILERLVAAPETTDLNENRQLTLNGENVEELRSRRLLFSFAAGMNEGRERLPIALDKMGLSGEVEVGVTEEQIPRLDDLGSQRHFEDFKEYCSAAGVETLDDGDVRHTEDWRKSRALGYGNHGLLLAFPYNTPSQALTCLWSRGKFRGVEWVPLLPRRKKV